MTAVVVEFDATDAVAAQAALVTLAPAANDKTNIYRVGSRGYAWKYVI